MTLEIADCETDNLLPAMTRLWMVQVGQAEGDDATVYCDVDRDLERRLLEKGVINPIRPLKEGIERLRDASQYVFHNGLMFDMEAINRFFPGTILREKLLDTLVMARLAFPEERSHSLKDWGKRLNVSKGDYAGNFQQVDEELLVYAQQDVVTGRALFKHVQHVRGWGTSCDLEHRVAYVIGQQVQNGFALDVPKAEALAAELRGEQVKLEAELQTAFPPIERTIEFTPRVNNAKRGYVKGQLFVKRRMEAFNPSSRQHVAERLQGLGWRPTQFGADGVPTVNEKVLGAMKHPLAKLLMRSFRLEKQLGMLADGRAGWLKLVGKDGRLHGRVNPNGARTGRMTHSTPNVAQTDKRDVRMRECFIPKKGWKLIGVDGEAIQARVLSHYLAKYDGGQLAERLVNGDSAQRTDAHSANLKALVQAKVFPQELWDEGFKAGREGAKTCLYAKLFGSSDAGLGHTAVEVCRKAGLQPPRIPFRELGRMVNVALARSMVGLDKLEEFAGKRVKEKGSLPGIDGRQIAINQPRLSLVTLCQSGEAILMKLALTDFYFNVAPSSGWTHGVDYGLCASIHDEQQIEARPEIIEALGAAFAECIRQAGITLKLRCAFAGKASPPGDSWAATH